MIKFLRFLKSYKGAYEELKFQGQVITVYGKTFVVVHKIHYSLGIFRGASERGHHVLYTASDSRGKLSRSAEKTT